MGAQAAAPGRGGTDDAVPDGVHEAADTAPVHGLARAGLVARGVVYLLLGVLAVQLAFGQRRGETDQRGALQTIASGSTAGVVVVWLLAAGLFGYAVLRLKEAVLGQPGQGDGWGTRLQAAVGVLMYGGLGVSAVQVALGSRSSQAGKQASLSARLLQHTGGRWLLGVVGLVVVGVGIGLAREGITRKAEKGMLLPPDHRVRRAVTALCVVGGVSRGVVVGLAGVFVVVAAVRVQPGKARGLDQGLRELADTGAGSVLLAVLAVGLVAFGLFGLAEARWRRT